MTDQGNIEPFGLVYKFPWDKLCTETVVSKIRTREGELVWREVADDSPTKDEAVFTGKEVGDVISSLKNDMCRGPDFVEMEILKRSYGIIHSELLKLYSGGLEYGVVPVRWKFRAILKGLDKPEADPKSYRPICLLSVLGKVLLKMVSRRQRGLLAGPDFYPDWQYRFRTGRSTQDSVLSLRELVSGAEEKYVLGL